MATQRRNRERDAAKSTLPGEWRNWYVRVNIGILSQFPHTHFRVIELLPWNGALGVLTWSGSVRRVVNGLVKVLLRKGTAPMYNSACGPGPKSCTSNITRKKHLRMAPGMRYPNTRTQNKRDCTLWQLRPGLCRWGIQIHSKSMEN